MPHQKTSQARYISARLNPTTSSEDKEALAIIDGLISQGFNPHQIIVDAILRAGHWTPEMFPKQGSFDMVALMESLLSNFAREIIEEIHKAGFTMVSENGEQESGDTSEFVNNFARTFMQRQQRALGDKE
jgi:hypothetical protein